MDLIEEDQIITYSNLESFDDHPNSKNCPFCNFTTGQYHIVTRGWGNINFNIREYRKSKNREYLNKILQEYNYVKFEVNKYIKSGALKNKNKKYKLYPNIGYELIKEHCNSFNVDNAELYAINKYKLIFENLENKICGYDQNGQFVVNSEALKGALSALGGIRCIAANKRKKKK